jgi:hypothetical protein
MSKEREPRARRRAARRVIDWPQAAELLAQGLTIATVAERVGCAPTTLARKRRQDPAFRDRLTRCRTPEPKPEGSRLPDLRSTLQRAIADQVGTGNVRVILWLAERLKLVTRRTNARRSRSCVRSSTTSPRRSFASSRACATSPEERAGVRSHDPRLLTSPRSAPGLRESTP